jgi:outer membrane protein assembly factor BamB
VENTSVDSYAVIPSGKELFNEIVLRLEDATPGTAIFLGDEKGAPLFGIGFVLNKQTNGVISFVPPGDFNAMPRGQDIPIRGQVVPMWGSGQWLKLVVGRDVLRLFVGNDGEHWNEVKTMQRKGTGYSRVPFSTVGLRLVGSGKQEQVRKITLRHLEIRPARSFSQFLPEPLAAKVPDFFALGGKAESLVEWVSAAVSSCPEGVELSAWLRACAAYCLRKPEWQAFRSTTNARPALRPQLFMGLVESALLDEKISLVAALELVHEISLFSGHWDLTHTSSFAAWGFRKLGEAAARRGEKKAYSFMKPWLFSTPSIFGKGLYPLPPVLITRELLYYASAAEWEAGAEFCRQIRYWNRRGYPQTNAAAWIAGQEEVKEYVGWSEVDFSRRLGRKDEFQGVPLSRHPLVTEYSKEGYNTLAEFQASIENGAYNDACTILTSSDTSFIQGLLPDMQDQDLMVAWRLALVIALEEQPELRRTLQKKYANLGELRLKRSISRGDSEAVDAVTRQFYGTVSSVDAYIWLGDQALGIGESLLAEGYYRRARKNAQLASVSAIEARQRLAAAFSGRDLGKPPSAAVHFGDLTLAPDDFEKMVSDLRQRYHSEESGYDDSLPVDSSVKVSPPGIYTAERVGQFDFDKRFKGHRPNIPALATDWVGRQMALTVFGDYLLVNDRNDLRAYELASGKLRWSHLAGGQRGGSREWPLLPMRPIVSGDLVVTRMISRQGPRLECLGLSDGIPKWVFATRDHAVSNPLLVEGDVVLLNLRRHEELGHELLFTRLARSTGEVLDERSLVNFRDDSKSRMFRQIQLGRSVDRLVASGYGSVICTDLRGRLLWVRKQPWRSFVRSAKWYLNHPVRPLFADGHVLISQPADESVASLRTDTGRLRWKAPVRELRQILGIADGKVIVSATGRLVALSLEDGRVVWEQQHGASRGFMVSGGDGAILSVAPVVRDNAMKSAGWGTLGLLSWVDVKDGRKLASWVVDFKLGAAAKGLHAGPMISTRDGILLLAGEHDGDSRNIFRLVSKSRKFNSVKPSGAFDCWLPGTTSLKAGVASTLFPGWTLLETERVGLGSFVREIEGVGPVFSADTKGQGGPSDIRTQLGRLVQVPASGKQRLRLQLGSEGATGWTVEVRANGESLARNFIPEVPPPSGNLEEYSWLEDSVPQAAQEQGGWVWARKPDPVHSGERSLMLTGNGRQERSFRNSTYWLVAAPGDQLFAWVWIDPKNPPKVIQLKFGSEAPAGMFEHSVFWGDLQALGEPPPAPTPRRLGDLPPAGQWVRLQIAADSMGIKPGTVLRQMAFLQVDGTVYYDKVGILSRSAPKGLPLKLLGPRRWTNIEVDLSRFAGKQVWLRAGRVTEDEKKGRELWSKLELTE